MISDTQHVIPFEKLEDVIDTLKLIWVDSEQGRQNCADKRKNIRFSSFFENYLKLEHNSNFLASSQTPIQYYHLKNSLI